MRYQSYLFPALITLLLITTFSYVDYAVTAVIMILATIYVVRGALKAQTIITYSLSPIMLMYLIWLYVVTVFSPVPHASVANLVMLAGLPLMYLLATQLPSFFRDWQKLSLIFAMFGLVVALWAVWQVVNHIGYGDATGPFSDRNAFAAALNLLWFPVVFSLVASLSSSKLGWSSAAYAFVAFFIGLALFATTSRGGILTWAILLPILIWSIYRYTKSIKIVVLVLSLSALSYLTSDYFLHNTIADRTFALGQDASTSARFQMWQSTFDMALAHPFLGTGWGTYAYYYPAFRLATETTTAGFFAHNDYLQIAAEGGFVALIIALILLLGIIWQLKLMLLSKITDKSFESVALLLGVLALFVHAVVNFIFYFSFMSVIAGLYLARVAQLMETPKAFGNINFSALRRPVGKLVSSLLLLLVMMPYIMQIAAQLCLTGSKPGLKVIQLVSPNATPLNVANVISSFYPSNGLAQEYLFRTYEYYLDGTNSINLTLSAREELLRNAIRDFEAFRKRNANLPSFGTREVQLILNNADIASFNQHAYRVLSDNLKADPSNGESMIMLARLQAQEGKRVEAKATLVKAYSKVFKKRDQLLIRAEYLRQLAFPKSYPVLADIESELQSIKLSVSTGKVDAELADANIYEKLNEKLIEVEMQINAQD